MREAQELYCHNCDNYVRFVLDLSFDDNYVLDCPECGHKYYRVVRDGKITDVRWGRDPSQDQINTISWTAVTSTSSSSTSTYDQYRTHATSGDPARYFLYQSWSNAST